MTINCVPQPTSDMTSRVVAPNTTTGNATTTTTTKKKSQRQPQVAFPWKRSLLPPTSVLGGARNYSMSQGMVQEEDGSIALDESAGPTPYSLRLASSARKRPRTTEERFATSFSCDVEPTPATPMGAEDLPGSYIMINVPQEVPGLAITNLSIEFVVPKEHEAAQEGLKHALLVDPTRAGVVVDVMLQTLDKVGRAVRNEKPVVVATFGGGGAACSIITAASYDSSLGDIPISSGQHMMLFAFIRNGATTADSTTASGGEQVKSGNNPIAAAAMASKVVLHVVGHVILPPSEEGDECGVSSRSVSLTSCPRREARKFITKVHQRSTVTLGDAAALKVQSTLLCGLGEGAARVAVEAATTPIQVAAASTSSSSATPPVVAAPSSSSSSTSKKVNPTTPAATSSSKAERARAMLLKRREADATTDGTPAKAARKGLVPRAAGGGKKKQ